MRSIWAIDYDSEAGSWTHGPHSLAQVPLGARVAASNRNRAPGLHEDRRRSLNCTADQDTEESCHKDLHLSTPSRYE